MNFFILGEFPELPENFRIPNYPRMRSDITHIWLGQSGQGAQQTTIKIHRKYDLNEAIMEKSPCI